MSPLLCELMNKKACTAPSKI